MKKLIVFAGIFFSIQMAAQTDFGIKGGLNYGDNGDVEFRDFSTTGEDVVSNQGESSMGYHFGIFMRSYLGDKLFIRPEVIYTQTRSNYNFNNRETRYRIRKIDVPLLVGFDVLGPVQVFGGPSLQYIVNTDLEDVRLSEVEHEFTVGLQFGVGLQFDSFGIDFRYERGLQSNEAHALDLQNAFGAQRIDTRPNQFIFSAYFML